MLQAAGRRIPFAFLEDVKGRFVSRYGSAAQAAVAYEYNTEFSKVRERQQPQLKIPQPPPPHRPSLLELHLRRGEASPRELSLHDWPSCSATVHALLPAQNGPGPY